MNRLLQRRAAVFGKADADTLVQRTLELVSNYGAVAWVNTTLHSSLESCFVANVEGVRCIVWGSGRVYMRDAADNVYEVRDDNGKWVALAAAKDEVVFMACLESATSELLFGKEAPVSLRANDEELWGIMIGNMEECNE